MICAYEKSSNTSVFECVCSCLSVCLFLRLCVCHRETEREVDKEGNTPGGQPVSLGEITGTICSAAALFQSIFWEFLPLIIYDWAQAQVPVHIFTLQHQKERNTQYLTSFLSKWIKWWKSWLTQTTILVVQSISCLKWSQKHFPFCHWFFWGVTTKLE